MPKMVMQKEWCVFMFVIICFSCIRAATLTANGTVSINGEKAIAVTNENFVCATLDWWPPTKCDYGTCSWGKSSLLNVDLKSVVLLNAVKEFAPLLIRLGGTLQDRVLYQTRNSPCIPFALNASQLYGFTEGCLPLARWDQLNAFFNKSGALITFGLNALNGKTIHSSNATATGHWDYTNAASLLRYTVKKGYNVYGWELGNELGGTPIPIGVGVAPKPYASDTIAFHGLIEEIYKDVKIKPLILAPGGIFESDWFKSYIAKTKGVLDVITHHVYSLGSGRDENLIQRILNATVLDEGASDYRSLHNILKKAETSTVAWISEAGGAFNSGQDGVTNAFVFSFWYLDQLGIASVYDTKTYCRQTLVGGNYGLLNTTTLIPNPDYYSALLWHRLMGRHVLSTKFGGTKSIRAYAHCAKQSKGISILLLNLDGNTTVRAMLGNEGVFGGKEREEYHLSPMDGNIQSRTALLNGKALIVDSYGVIPALEPIRVASSVSVITVQPHSIVFVHIPHVALPACR